MSEALRDREHFRPRLRRDAEALEDLLRTLRGDGLAQRFFIDDGTVALPNGVDIAPENGLAHEGGDVEEPCPVQGDPASTKRLLRNGRPKRRLQRRSAGARRAGAVAWARRQRQRGTTLDGDTQMSPEDFIHAYEKALASRQWALVEPLVHENACVTFSNGTVHIGRAAIRNAYQANFSTIEDEDYRISNVHWIRRGEDVSVYVFDFAWRGRIDGREAKGAGRGTSVLVRRGSDWQLLAEHLGPPRSPAAA